MNNLMDSWSAFYSILPSLLSGLLLIIVAWIVAVLVRKAVTGGLDRISFGERLVGWGAVQSAEQGENIIHLLGQFLYYLVWVLFLPGIFETLGVTTIATPIQNMLDVALSFLPNLIAAVFLVVVGAVIAKLVRNLVYNLALTLNIDRWISKFTGQEDTETTDADTVNADSIATVLANIVYVVVLIPILTIALEALGIRSISEPIIGVLNAILAAIPNILVAIILLAVGIVLAKFVGDLVTSLLKGTGVNKLTDNLGLSKPMNIDLAQISGQIVTGLISLFFIVEALSALNLGVLNAIGAAVIAYLPNVIFALIILGLGLIGGQWLSDLIVKTSGSKWTGTIVQYIVLAFSIFMVLDQLNFASQIVSTAFIFIIGGLSVAFALSFGLGGREFAKKQLEKLDDKVEEETSKNENNTDVH